MEDEIVERSFDGYTTQRELKTGDGRNSFPDRPKSWWRTKLGYVAIMVIDKGKWKGFVVTPTGVSAEGEITKLHYEWQWRPFQKRRKS